MTTIDELVLVILENVIERPGIYLHKLQTDLLHQEQKFVRQLCAHFETKQFLTTKTAVLLGSEMTSFVQCLDLIAQHINLICCCLLMKMELTEGILCVNLGTA